MGFLDDYEPVEDRLAKFWEEHPEGRIVTNIVPAPEGQWIVRAQVWRGPVTQVTEYDLPTATGLAQEHVTEKGVNSTSALENCETSAIGRALANLGYAAKGKRPSREEMVKVTKDVEPSEADRAFKWIGEESKIFKSWNKAERTKAYQAAMSNLAFDVLTNMDEAHKIFDHMMGQYSERPIEQLPLEGDK